MNTAEKKRSVIVGIFVVLGIMILVAGILTLGSQQKVFVKSIVIRSVFDDVEGLTAGNNVWFSGVKVGTVKSIHFHGQSQVEILMSIEQDARDYIRKDAMASISSDGFIGNKIVVIQGGSPQAPPVEDQDLLRSANPEDMMETLQVNNKNLVEITENLKRVTASLAEGEGPLGAFLTDSSLTENFRAIMASLQRTARHSEEVSGALVRFTGKLDTEGSTLNALVSDTGIYRSLERSVSRLESVSNSAAELSSQLKDVGMRLDSTDNTVGMLLNDAELAGSIKETMENLEGSTEKLEENMEALRHNFLFRRYFRKKEKAEAGQ